MKAVFILALLFVASVHTVENWGMTEEDDVIVLTTSEFDAAVQKHQFMLVEFYAPWCGHCKKLAPEYSKAAKRLKESDPPVPLAKVDATVETDLGQRFGVQGYPTLKWFVNGKPVDYQGGRVEDQIVSWVQKKTGPASKELKTKEELTETQAANSVVVAYLGEESDAGYKTFLEVGASFDGVPFVHTFNADLVSEHGGKRVVLFKKFDDLRVDLEGEFEKEKLLAWIDENRFEVVMTFEGDSAIERVFGKEAAAVFLFNDKSDDEVNKTFAEVAKAMKGRIVFSWSTVTTGLGQRLAEYVGVKAEETPCVRLVHPAKGDLSKFVFEGEVTVESLTKFVSDWENGLLNRTYKSQEVPQTNDEPVKVVVGKSFEQLVLNEEQDVLMEFYAPWCGHCKSLAPKYEAAAQKLAHMKQLVIAKMDSTENEVPGVSIKGFPTIKFYKRGQKDKPMDFDGDRTEEGIIKFLKENVSFPWTDAETETDL